ncbi:MAG: hypothetical protein ACYSR8_09795 [Planctomycetota bacterium]|jgi:hypothetical protein
MTDSKQCKHFDTCSAPICPLDESSLKSGLWYPDEKICSSRGFQQKRWIKNQKKIKKVGSYDTGYFTKVMLDRRLFVKKGIKGIDPDKDGPKQIKKWLHEHPDRAPSRKQLNHLKNMAEVEHLRKKTA